MEKKIMCAGILTILLISDNLSGQVQKWDIVSLSNQSYNDVILHDLKYDTIYVKVYGDIFAIPIDSIYYLKREKPSLSAAGVIFSMTVGGIIGYEVAKKKSQFYYGYHVMVGMLSGGIVGFLLGEAIGADEYCYLRSKSHEEKVRELRKLMERHKN